MALWERRRSCCSWVRWCLLAGKRAKKTLGRVSGTRWGGLGRETRWAREVGRRTEVLVQVVGVGRGRRRH